MIKDITTDDLRRMQNREGLILQGCGGDPTDWLDGINRILTEAGILLDGTKFDFAEKFSHDNLTCLLFPFSEDVHVDIGKLAIWRLRTHGDLGGTWLSDFVPNRLGGFLSADLPSEKSKCPLIGQDGNIFNLIGIASRTLRQNGMDDAAKAMQKEATSAASYEEALGIIGSFVDITDGSDIDEEDSEGMVM